MAIILNTSCHTGCLNTDEDGTLKIFLEYRRASHTTYDENGFIAFEHFLNGPAITVNLITEDGTSIEIDSVDFGCQSSGEAGDIYDPNHCICDDLVLEGVGTSQGAAHRSWLTKEITIPAGLLTSCCRVVSEITTDGGGCGSSGANYAEVWFNKVANPIGSREIFGIGITGHNYPIDFCR